MEHSLDQKLQRRVQTAHDAEVLSYVDPHDSPLQKAFEKAKHTAESCAAHVLRKASEHLNQRATEYDQPTGERAMAKTVEMFNTLTGKQLTEVEGWKFMAILKMVRSSQGAHKLDNYEDGAAYFALAAESAQGVANGTS